MAEKPRTQDAGRGVDARDARSKRDKEQAQPDKSDPGARQDPFSADSIPGQLARDDRGNISWEWADNPEFQADDTAGSTARIHALAPRHLAVEDEDDLAALNKTPAPQRKSPKSGYDPYESGEPTKETWKKKRDLREFGKWIALKKRMQNRSGEE